MNNTNELIKEIGPQATEIADKVMGYLTFENIMFFIAASMIFTIAIYFFKIALKILGLALVIGIGYYYFIASPVVKNKMETCVKSSVADKKVSPVCKKIFN